MLYEVITGIGKSGNLLVHIPGDLPRFKKITTGHTVVMGRKTYESLPNGPLKKRKNIVLTRNKNLEIPGAKVISSIDEIDNPSNEEIFIIGGGEIYNQTINIADKLLITQIDKEFEADTFFPQLNDNWLLSESEKVTDKGDFTFSYNTYLRK